jgi:hypothetical protein
MGDMTLTWVVSRKTRAEGLRATLRMNIKRSVRVFCIVGIFLLCVYVLIEKSGSWIGVPLDPLPLGNQDIPSELFFAYLLLAAAAMTVVFLFLPPVVSFLIPSKYELTDKHVMRNGCPVVHWENVSGYSMVTNTISDEEPAVLALHFKRRKKYQRGIILPENDKEKLQKVLDYVAERFPLIEEAEPGTLYAKLLEVSRRKRESN